jgi:hypothetical protein
MDVNSAIWQRCTRTRRNRIWWSNEQFQLEYGKADIVNFELGEEGQGNEDIPLDELDLKPRTLILETDSPHDDPDSDSDQFITTFRTIDGRDVLANLAAKDINTRGNDDPLHIQLESEIGTRKKSFTVS